MEDQEERGEREGCVDRKSELSAASKIGGSTRVDDDDDQAIPSE